VTITARGRGAHALVLDVHVETCGHKLPPHILRGGMATCCRERRHVVCGGVESGALKPDGSIVGNDNDEDPLKFEPHLPRNHEFPTGRDLRTILKDSQGR